MYDGNLGIGVNRSSVGLRVWGCYIYKIIKLRDMRAFLLDLDLEGLIHELLGGP